MKLFTKINYCKNKFKLIFITINTILFGKQINALNYINLLNLKFLRLIHIIVNKDSDNFNVLIPQSVKKRMYFLKFTHCC